MLDRMQLGEVPRKHHVQLRGPDGALRYEECFTRAGFDGPYSILYHLRRPHLQTLAAAGHGFTLPRPATAGPLAKRHYKTFDLPGGGASPLDARVPLLFNADVVASVSRPDREDPVYFVNGDADELHYVFEGGGTLRSPIGDLEFEAGDYVFVPRGMLHRWILASGPAQYWFSLEFSRGFGTLSQFRNDVGQLRMDAPYCHRDFRRPRFMGPLDEGLRESVVKRGGAFHGFTQADSPLDVVGWDGTVYPWAFPISNFQPRVSSVHLPPTWHGTFAASGALVCSFVPRKVDFAPDAIPCPYPHSSVDVDEVIFYARGQFTSRRGVLPGSVSYHPAGVPHGPHPGSYERSIGSTETDETAVMLDCALPLVATPEALGIEDPGYQTSFLD